MYRKLAPFLDQVTVGRVFSKLSIILWEPYLLASWQRYDMLELTWNQVIEQVVSHFSDSPSKAEDFLLWLTDSWDEGALLQSSVFATLLCFVTDLPSTWTQVFEQMLRNFLASTSSEATAMIQALSRLAYKHMEQKVFALDNLHPGPEQNLKAFLLVSFHLITQSLHTESSIDSLFPYSYYLCALHIHTLPHREQVALMEKGICNVHLEVLLDSAAHGVPQSLTKSSTWNRLCNLHMWEYFGRCAKTHHQKWRPNCTAFISYLVLHCIQRPLWIRATWFFLRTNSGGNKVVDGSSFHSVFP